ncbi:MAG: cell wall-binding repeat-containing protein, partial [Herbiconiux sp.]|nr:cell wall-binding repeat-containing protein [Herbiconiux sp.]
MRLRRPRPTAALAVLVAASALTALTGLPIAATDAPGRPTALPPPTRIAGADRYEQAAAVSRRGFAGSDTVYLASGERFPDALSTAAVAGRHGAPLLLTAATALPPATATEIVRRRPSLVVAVGGELSIADDVLEQVSRLIGGVTVLRLGGVDRYEASRTLVGEPTVGLPDAEVLVVATGATFPDALAAAPTAVRAGTAVLLVDGTAPAAAPAERTLLDALGVSGVRVACGPASVGPALEADLRRDRRVTRYDGPDRYAVAIALNADLPSVRTAYLASGESFPDALSGAPL